jgi:glycosyltransferase involved in cell wall biosynthesis
MDLYIVDPQLGMAGGHYLPYAKSVTAAAIDAGSHVVWYTNKNFKVRDLPSNVEIRPVFERYVFDEIQSQGDGWIQENFNGINRDFYRILVTHISSPKSGSTIVFPNLLHTQLYAVTEWANQFSKASRVVAILRWNNAYMEYNVSRGASRDILSLYKFCFDKAMVSKANIIFASDTIRLSNFYSQLSTIPIQYIPNPQVRTGDDVLESSSIPRDHHNPLVLSHIGGFSPLRGAHLLPDIFEKVLAFSHNVTIRCHVDDFESPIFNRLLDVQKRYKSRISIIGNVIDDTLYRDLFFTTDLLVMAYHPGFYHFGSSGVACEALSWGIPAVIPSNTTIFDEFSSVDAGFIDCSEWSYDAYANSIDLAINEIKSLTYKSHIAKTEYKKIVSPKAFLRKVMFDSPV